MKTFYMLNFVDASPKASSIDGTTYDSESEELEEDLFDDGISLEGEINSPLTVVINERGSSVKKKLMDCMFFSGNAGIVWLISARAKDVLEELNLPLEFFEITFKAKKREIKDYFLVNVIGKFKCVDWDKSDLDYDDDLESIMEYVSLILDESKIPEGTEIFLLGEDSGMQVVIAKRIKEAIEKADLTGFVLTKSHEYKSF